MISRCIVAAVIVFDVVFVLITPKTFQLVSIGKAIIFGWFKMLLLLLLL